MASIADIHFTADLDDARLQVDAKRAGNQAGTTMGQGIVASIKKSWSSENLGKGLVQGLGFAGALGAANLFSTGLRTVTDVIGSSIEAASDLNETLSKSDVVFGSDAAAVAKWGDKSAKAFGLSKQAAIEAAASFGNVFKGLGFASDESAKMSERLVELAGDLASFNNLDPTDALEKLRSGLAGEAEPLRAVGVFLTEAQVKAKAMQMGLGGAHRELTEGEKILARYQLILEQTKTAQGDFAKTSDGLANSQRIANAELENAQATLGEKLLPVQLAVTNAQIDLLEGISFLADGLSGKLSPAILAVAVNGGKLEEATRRARDQIMSLDDDTLAAAVQFGVLTQSEVDAANGAKYMSSHVKDDLIDVERSGREMGTAAGDGIRKIGLGAIWAQDSVEAAFLRIKNASAVLRRDLLGDATKLVNDYFDVLVTEDDLAANSAEISALRRKVASGSATKEEIAQLHRAEQAQAQMLADLASHGATTSKQFKDAMTGLLKRLKTAHGAERKAILAEILQLKILAFQAEIANKKVLSLSESISATILKGGYVTAAGAGAGRETGGTVIAGQAYLVNENTPRSEIFVPSVSGYVYPTMASATSATGGSGDTYNITNNVDIATPAARDPLAIARQLRRVSSFTATAARPTP